MTEKLNMSLDQIIQKTEVRRAKSVAVKSSAARRPIDKFDRRAPRETRGREDRGPREAREDRHRASAGPQPLKEVIVARPKVVSADRPSAATATTAAAAARGPSQPSTSSVFSRLGPAGALVVFKNLASSVQQEDVLELCKALGQVRELSFLRGFDGLGQARAHFSDKKAAQACVQKYHGLTLDGLEMQVLLDQSAPPALAVTVAVGAGERPTAATTGKSNVRAGLFGTALDSEPARTVTFERKHNKARNERRPLRK